MVPHNGSQKDGVVPVSSLPTGTQNIGSMGAGKALSPLPIKPTGTTGTTGTKREKTLPDCLQSGSSCEGEPVPGTPCPRRQRWAQIACPLDRSPRSLGGMWLAYYLDQGATLDDARGLARSTCRALYPETFPS